MKKNNFRVSKGGLKMSDKRKIKIIVAQMEIKGDLIEPECKEENLKHAEELLDKISEEKPDLVVLPEDFYCGYAYGPMNLPDFLKVDGYTRLAKKAKKGGFFLAGTVCVPPEEPVDFRTYINGFIIDPTGKVALTQKLLNPMKKAKQWLIPGEKISVLKTPLGNLGIVIGMDFFHPEIARALVLSGANIIICPMLMVDYIPGFQDTDYGSDFIKLSHIIKNTAIARAFENQCYVIVASGVGEYVRAEGHPLMGRSLAAGPQGIVAKTDSEKEFLLKVELDMEPLGLIRENFSLLESRQPTLNNLIK